MVQRLMKAGHECVVSDTHPQAVKDVVAKGAKSSDSIADFAKKLGKPRAVWMMVPAAVVDSVLTSLTPVLEPGDIVIDGGNSYYHDDIRRAGELKSKGIHYVDCGTSGGVWGSERGYCLMIGGEDAIVSHLDPIFKSLAPGFWLGGADARADRRAFEIRKRLLALRPERRGSLRKDGPQRYRVRHYGCLCRGIEHH
ncbi:MAG: NAD(P)-binding domain-containing protein [Terriglobales bacterium]